MRAAAVACAALWPLARVRGLGRAAWRPRFDALFVGDFDNYAQTVAERARGVAAGDRAGHEHVHCCLRPLAPSVCEALAGVDEATLAVYWLDGDPDRVFRAHTDGA